MRACSSLHSDSAAAAARHARFLNGDKLRESMTILGDDLFISGSLEHR